jgi:hypothetical protein
MTLTVGRVQVTLYIVKRDHCNETGCFRVSVPETGHRGAGAQLRFGAYVAGGSALRVGTPWAEEEVC